MSNKISLSKYIVDNSNIVSTIANYIKLTKKGHNYWSLCPFHPDKNPSMSISETKKIFKCFVCNEKGNIINFVMKYKNISFVDAIKEISEINNLNAEFLKQFINDKTNTIHYRLIELNNQANFIFHRTLLNSENADKLEYLFSRGLTQEIIDEYKIGYAPKGEKNKYLFSIMTNENNIMGDERDSNLIWTPEQLNDVGLAIIDNNGNYLDFFRDRIIIPIFNEHNENVGFSGRTLNKDEKIKYINTKSTQIFQKENILFNFNNFDKSLYNEIYIVEGYMDVFAFRRIGIDNVVASMGTSFTDKQIQLIKKFSNIKTINICFDNDNAGFNATVNLAEKLIKNNFNIFIVKPYDSSYKDIDELLNAKGSEDTIKIVNDQITFINYLILKSFHNKQLNEKEKILLTKNIIDIVNNFAFNELNLLNDLNMLSQYVNIDIDEIKKQIKKFNTNTYRNIQYNNPNFNKKFVPTNQNNKTISVSENIINVNKTKEKRLIEIICNNTDIAKLFIKYIYHTYFQDRDTTATYTLLIIFIKKLIDLNNDVSIEQLITIVENDFSQTYYHNQLLYFLKNLQIKNKNQSLSIHHEKAQGINLIIDLVNIIFHKRKKQIFIDNIEVKNRLDSLTVKYKKDINELTEVLENIDFED